MTLERILQAAVRSMITGRHTPMCYHSHVIGKGYVNDGSAVYNRADYLRQLEHDAQAEVDNLGFAPSYVEPGYTQPRKGIVFANWNKFPRELGDILERAGYEVEWSDEWTTCEECSRAYRTSPDSHGWKPSGDYCEQCGSNLCRECHEEAHPSTHDYYCGESGNLLVTIPDEAIDDCSHQGDCDEDVSAWVNDERIVWHTDRDTLVKALDGYGAWDDLETADLETLRKRVLWTACCDIREERDR